MLDVSGYITKDNSYVFHIFNTKYKVEVSENNIVSLNKSCFFNDEVRETVMQKILVPLLGDDISNLTERMEMINGAYEKAKVFYEKVNTPKVVLNSGSKIYSLDELACKYAIIYNEQLDSISILIRAASFEKDGLCLRINVDGTYFANYSTIKLNSELSEEDIKVRKEFLEKFAKKIFGLKIKLSDKLPLDAKSVDKKENLYDRAFKLYEYNLTNTFADSNELMAFANADRIR